MTRIELIEKRHKIIEHQLARRDFLGQFDKENYEAVLAGLVTLADAKAASKEARIFNPYKQLHRSYRGLINSLNFS